jgi:CRP/FNR family transcriptional regulator
MTATSPDNRYEGLRRSVFSVLPEPELRRLAGDVQEGRLLAGHLLYDPEVTVVATGLVRAFIGDGTGRQATLAYLRGGNTLGLAHLAGRRYPVAFQAIEVSRLVVVGNERALQLHTGHPALSWATARELATYLNDLESKVASYAFGSLRQRLASHLLALTAASDDESDGPPVHLALLVTAVGSPREVISRTLTPLTADGTLHVGPAGVTITDRQQLRDHANID